MRKKDQFLAGNKFRKTIKFLVHRIVKQRTELETHQMMISVRKKASDCNKFDKLELGYVPEL